MLFEPTAPTAEPEPVMIQLRAGNMSYRADDCLCSISEAAVLRSKALAHLSEHLGSRPGGVVPLGVSVAAFEHWLAVVNDRSSRQRELRSKTAMDLRAVLEAAAVLCDTETVAAACAELAEMLLGPCQPGAAGTGGHAPHTGPMHRLQKSAAVAVLTGLPEALQDAIIAASPTANPTRLLSTLPFSLSTAALNIHAPSAPPAAAPTHRPIVRTWIDGTGLHLAAAYAHMHETSAASTSMHVAVLEVTGLLAQRGRRPPYTDAEMASFIRRVCSHSGLQELSLNGVRLGPEAGADLRRGLPAMHALRRLEVCNAGVSLHDTVGAIAALPALDTVRLSHVRAAADAALCFAEHIGDMHGLTALALSACKLDATGWRELLSRVAALPCLASLTLERNSLDLGGCESASWAVVTPRGRSAQQWRSLRTLSIASMRRGAVPACSSKDSNAVSETYKRSAGVEVAGEEPGGCGLVTFVSGLTGLTSLSVTQAAVSGAEAAAFAAPLRQLRSLQLLGNRITAGGMRRLAPVLATLRTLTSLDLSLNSLGDAGVCMLAQHVGKLQQLEVCKLCSNEIGDVGADRFFEASLSLPALREVSVMFNSIQQYSDAAAGYMSRSGSSGCQLRHA